MDRMNLIYHSFIKSTKVDINNIKLNRLSKRQILTYILVKYNQIRLLELILKIKIKLTHCDN